MARNKAIDDLSRLVGFDITDDNARPGDFAMNEPKYDVYKWRGNACEMLAPRLSADEAARLVDLDPNDLSAAVDEHGRCDVDRYVTVGAGDPAPGRK